MDKEEAVMMREEDKEEGVMMRKLERLERKEDLLEDVIAGLHSRSLSAWLPPQRYAIDQEIIVANKKLEELRVKLDEI